MDPSTKKEMSIWSYDILILDVFSTALKIILRLIFCGRAKRDHTIWFSEFRFMGKWCLLCTYGKEKWVKSGGNGSTGVVDERSEETRLVRLRKSPTIKVVQQKKKNTNWVKNGAGFYSEIQQRKIPNEWKVKSDEGFYYVVVQQRKIPNEWNMAQVSIQ